MIEPKNGEWWLCERGGVKTVFLRKDEEWRSDEKDSYDYCNVTPLFKMIEDKPSSCEAANPKRTRTEYEKVTESIFDLRDEFERGELYQKPKHATNHTPIVHIQTLAQSVADGFCYRKVEKEIDWRDDIYEWQHTKKIGIYTPLDFTVAHLISAHPDKFLELCRVALRANGELD